MPVALTLLYYPRPDKVFVMIRALMSTHRPHDQFSWLGSVAPCFPLQGKQVTVISKPIDFYNELMRRCERSEHRVTWASLYLGTGEQERNLVSALDQRLTERPMLKAFLLLDFARSSRNKISSRSLLLPLLAKHEGSCQVALYHSPALRGIVKRILPQRYNELVGLQHMKIYLFDDSVIISGANLSNDYFTNRQDRYLLIEDCKALADFLDGLVRRVADFSLYLSAKDTTHVRWKEHPFLGDKSRFVSSARHHIWSFYQSYVGNRLAEAQADTWLYPLIEMGQLGIACDSKATRRLIEDAPPKSSLCMSTGYFNLPKQYVQSIVYNSRANFSILMAHPTANGFLGAKGPAGGIPAAYTLLAHRFLNLLRGPRVSLWEYSRPGWTYHAKGLWFTLPGAELPALTLIGSPNFGYRSVHRDLELQVALVTSDIELSKSLGQEQAGLQARSSPFPNNVLTLPDRKPPLWVKMVVAFFKNFF